jgi:hypothetical protein
MDQDMILQVNDEFVEYCIVSLFSVLYVVPCLNTYDLCVGIMCGVYGYDERVARFIWSTSSCFLHILIE